MTHQNKSKKQRVVAISLAILVFLLLSESSIATTTIRSCLRNCHHCKTHFGDFFVAHLCAKTCTQLRGRLEINCKDLVSIAPFLDPSVLQHISNDVWLNYEESNCSKQDKSRLVTALNDWIEAKRREMMGFGRSANAIPIFVENGLNFHWKTNSFWVASREFWLFINTRSNGC